MVDGERVNGGSGAQGPEAELLEEHLERFRERFGGGAAPRLFFAPGRINLMGAHLDYNGGPVMPMAIDRGTLVAARPRADRRVLLASTRGEGVAEFELDRLPGQRQGSWCDYPLGVLLAVLERASGSAGLELLFGGNLAIGAGLSSSASICVATAFTLDHLWGLDLGPRARVEVALWAEREFVGVRCGIMDPFAVGLSKPDHLLWLDCKDESTEHLPLDAGRLAIAVADTGVRRDLAQGAFNRRVHECAQAFSALRRAYPEATCLRDVPLAVLEAERPQLAPIPAKRAQHVLEEVRRTEDARRALAEGDEARFGAQMSAAHASLRDLFEVSVPELDCLVEGSLAWPGVLGSRLTGAGFGGCTVTLLERDARGGFEEHLARRFEERFGRRPGVHFFGGDPGPREL